LKTLSKCDIIFVTIIKSSSEEPELLYETIVI